MVSMRASLPLFVLFCAVRSQMVVINEVITNSITGATTFGNGLGMVDSVELFNPTTKTVNLTGMYIIDSSASPYPYYSFAKDTMISPRGFLVLQQSSSGCTLCNFTFGLGSADNVRLFKIKDGSLLPDQTQDTLIDGKSWTAHQLPGGRCPDGSNNWVNPEVGPSMGSNNKCSYSIVVNEVLTNPPTSTWPSYSGIIVDSVELYNPTSTPFDVSGMVIRLCVISIFLCFLPVTFFFCSTWLIVRTARCSALVGSAALQALIVLGLA
jgi:hypothetical protein